MAATVQRFIVQGSTSLAEAVPATAGGAANAGKIPALDPNTGTFDPTMMPTGVAADVKVCTASEALAGPCLVNLYANGGAITARNADGSTQGKPADGYVLGAVAQGAQATVYLGSGIVPGFTGLTPGDAFLSAATPGAVAAAGAASAGQTFQKVGKALDATTLQFTAASPSPGTEAAMAQRKTVVVTAAGLAEMPAADTSPVPAYSPSGVVAGCKLWIGEATTLADGSWSVDLSSAGFTAPPKIQAQPISASAAMSAAAQATVTARSATKASGYAILPAVIVLGGIAIGAAGAGLTIMVIAVGP